MELQLEALRSFHEANKKIALAELSILLQSPVGIGEHTNIIEECNGKIKVIAESEECIKVITKIANENLPHLNQHLNPEENDES